MNLQNRVDPWGALNSVDARGTYMGNRGILHNDNKVIVAQWRHKAWVICQLEFKGRKREVFSPNNYSELFLWMRRALYQQVIDLALSAIGSDTKRLSPLGVLQIVTRLQSLLVKLTSNCILKE